MSNYGSDDDFDGEHALSRRAKIEAAELCLKQLNQPMDLQSFERLISNIERAQNAFLTIRKSGFVLQFLRNLKAAMEVEPVFAPGTVNYVQLISMAHFGHFSSFHNSRKTRNATEFTPFFEWVNEQTFRIDADPDDIASELESLHARASTTAQPLLEALD